MNGGLTVSDIDNMKRDKARLDWLEQFCGNPVRRFIDQAMERKTPEPLMKWDATTKTWYMTGERQEAPVTKFHTRGSKSVGEGLGI